MKKKEVLTIGIIALVVCGVVIAGSAVATKSSGGVGHLTCQNIDITAKEVTLYIDPDVGDDNTGEIFAQYTTDADDFDVSTGIISVPQWQTVPFTVHPYEWVGLSYCADSLHILVWDKDVAWNDNLYDGYHSLSLGPNLVISVNNNIKLKTEVTVHNP
ncbi:MAG: hypothetical protein WBC40_06270 [Halobacteriota archaeon]